MMLQVPKKGIILEKVEGYLFFGIFAWLYTEMY